MSGGAPADSESPAAWGDHAFVLSSAEWAHPGKGHDRTLITRSFAGIADGSTPLGPQWPDPGPLAVSALNQLSSFASDGSGRTVTEVFAAAIRATRETERPSLEGATCAVAVTWLDRTEVVVGVLGDCLALIETTTGDLTVLTDRAVTRLDDVVAAAAPADRLALLRRHRALANTAAGYWIYADDPAAADHVVQARVPVNDVRTVFLCTDGLNRVRQIRSGFAQHVLPGAGFLSAVMDSVSSRIFAERPAKGLDDEAAVLISRPASAPR